MVKYREIEPSDDARVAEIARCNLRKFHLDLPGTVYFDPELDHLSAFYSEKPDKRRYFVALGKDGQVIGGAGLAEFEGMNDCAELQKLYLVDSVKGKGYGKDLVRLVEEGRFGGPPIFVNAPAYPPVPGCCGKRGTAGQKKEWNFHKESSCFGDGTAADGGV